MGNKIKVSIAQRLDVPNIFKDVPNFMKDASKFLNDVPNFLKDVLRVSEYGTTFNYFLKIPKEINEPWVII